MSYQQGFCQCSWCVKNIKHGDQVACSACMKGLEKRIAELELKRNQLRKALVQCKRIFKKLGHPGGMHLDILVEAAIQKIDEVSR